MTERQVQIANLWGDADQAAVDACCAAWPVEARPDTAYLRLA
jgi:hypothetical protein